MDRRDFLKTTGVVVAGSAISPNSLAQTLAGGSTKGGRLVLPINRNWRFSPLAEITPENAAKLSPVWAMSTGGQFGGLESTPLFRDGVLYFSADYARVFAVDGKSGNILWRYEPEYEEGFNAILCCGPIHRGLALKDDLVIVARLDSKLEALNRAGLRAAGPMLSSNRREKPTLQRWKDGVARQARAG